MKMCDFGISGYLVDSVAKTMDAGCKPYMAVSGAVPTPGSERTGLGRSCLVHRDRGHPHYPCCYLHPKLLHLDKPRGLGSPALPSLSVRWRPAALSAAGAGCGAGIRSWLFLASVSSSV